MTMSNKEIRHQLQLLALDSIRCSRAGVWRIKRGYFYRHGASPQTVWARIKQVIPTAVLVSAEDRFNPWPRDSYFLVEFTVPMEVVNA
jgi:hypothetical protein